MTDAAATLRQYLRSPSNACSNGSRWVFALAGWSVDPVRTKTTCRGVTRPRPDLLEPAFALEPHQLQVAGAMFIASP